MVLSGAESIVASSEQKGRLHFQCGRLVEAGASQRAGGGMMIAYRPLADGDRDFCVRVHHLSTRAYVEPIWGWDEAQQDILALEFLEHRNAIHEIALLGEVPIGYLSYQDKADTLFLNQLSLHPDQQGQGHGSEIMARLVRMARSGRKPIQLSVLTTNPRARAFYERHGFIVVGTTAERVRMRRSDDHSHSK
jgi:ribosomal protein S18 acetylase RimI-like enzyme